MVKLSDNHIRTIEGITMVVLVASAITRNSILGFVGVNLAIIPLKCKTYSKKEIISLIIKLLIFNVCIFIFTKFVMCQVLTKIIYWIKE